MYISHKTKTIDRFIEHFAQNKEPLPIKLYKT